MLITAGEQEQRDRWRSLSETLAGELGSGAVLGHLRIGAPPTTLAPLGLFQGLGGVLYALALASKPQLPSVLTWGIDLRGDNSQAATT
jgi:hypothetical protein